MLVLKKEESRSLVAIKKADQIGKAASFSAMLGYTYIFLFSKSFHPCVWAAKNRGFSIIVYLGTVRAVIDALPMTEGFYGFNYATKALTRSCLLVKSHSHRGPQSFGTLLQSL